MFEYLFQINVQLSDPFTPRLHDVVVYSDWSSDDPELQRLMATWATTLAAMDSTGPCAEHRTSEDEEVGRVANSGVSKPGKKSHVCFGGPFFRRHITVRCFKLYISDQKRFGEYFGSAPHPGCDLASECQTRQKMSCCSGGDEESASHGWGGRSTECFSPIIHSYPQLQSNLEAKNHCEKITMTGRLHLLLPMVGILHSLLKWLDTMGDATKSPHLTSSAISGCERSIGFPKTLSIAQ